MPLGLLHVYPAILPCSDINGLVIGFRSISSLETFNDITRKRYDGILSAM